MSIRHAISTFLSLAILATLLGCSKSPEQHLESAKQFIQKADLSSAVIELKTVLGKQPNNHEARSLLGVTYFDLGMYPDAEDQLERALKLGAGEDTLLPLLAKAQLKMGEASKVLDTKLPTSGLSANALASLYATRASASLLLGNKADAETAIKAGVKADATQTDLLLAQAKLALANRQKPQAEQFIYASLKSDPKSIDALYLNAELLQSDGKDDQALKAYQEIVTQNPFQYRAHLGIAALYMKNNNMTAAESSIKAAEKIAGKVPAVMYARGLLELRLGNLENAVSAFDKVLRVVPDNLPTLLAYAAANNGLGNYEQSISSANKVLSMVPGNLPAAEILADSLIKTGEVDKATKTLAPFLQQYPDDPRLLSLAGTAYLKAKDYNKAMSYLDHAAQVDPNNAQIRNRQAAAYLGEGESDKALATLQTAANLGTTPGKADVGLIVLHIQRKEYDQALQAVDKLEKQLPNNPVVLNLRAGVLLAKQDKIGARKALEQALAIQPDFFPAAMNLARLDIAENKTDDARKQFQSILDKDNNNSQAMLALADLAAMQKNESEYIHWLEKALKGQPRTLKPYIALVRYYLAKKNNDKALSLANDAVNGFANSPEALSLLGSTQLAAGNANMAVDTYSEVVKLKPDSAPAQFQLGKAQLAAKQYDAAQSSLEKAVSLDPRLIQAQIGLIALHIQAGRYDAALKIAQQIQSTSPDKGAGLILEGDILMAAKRPALALAAYDKAAAKQINNAILIKQQQALVALGRPLEGEARLSAWLKQHPDDISVRFKYAESLLSRRQYALAVEQYRTLSGKVPNNLLVLNNLAYALAQMKDPSAVPAAQQALKLAPDNPATLDTMGWALAQTGQPAKALTYLRQALSKQPDAGDIHYHLAAALAANGDKARARQELKQLMDSGLDFSQKPAAQALLQSL